MATVACPMECDLWAECLCHMSAISSFSPPVGVFIHSVMTLIDWAPKVDAFHPATKLKFFRWFICCFKLWNFVKLVDWLVFGRKFTTRNDPETFLLVSQEPRWPELSGSLLPREGGLFPSIPHKRRGLFFRATGSLTGPNQPHSSLLAAGCRTEPNNRIFRHFGFNWIILWNSF